MKTKTGELFFHQNLVTGLEVMNGMGGIHQGKEQTVGQWWKSIFSREGQGGNQGHCREMWTLVKE